MRAHAKITVEIESTAPWDYDPLNDLSLSAMDEIGKAALEERIRHMFRSDPGAQVTVTATHSLIPFEAAA